MFYIAEHKNYSGKNPFKILHYKLFPINRVTKICRNDICEYGKLTIRTVNGRIDADKINRKLGAISRRLILPNTLKNCKIERIFCTDPDAVAINPENVTVLD